MQRSVQAGRNGLTEADYDDLLRFEDSDRYSEREKVALRYTSAIPFTQAWRTTFLVGVLDRGIKESCPFYVSKSIGPNSGLQRWIEALGIGHRQVLGDTDIGLAPPTPVP